MEMLATLLCMFSMFAGIFFIIASIVRKIWKKPKKKLYSRGLLISAIVFVLSIVLFAVFETPETKAENEQRRIEAQKEKEEKEQAEKEAKEQKAKEKEEQQAKEKAEKELEEKAQVEQEKKEESETKTNNKKSSSDKSATQPVEIETNYLKQLKVRDNPVMNGAGTEKIGTYGFIKAEKELAQQVTEQEYIEFCNDVVRDSGYNWFSIDFGDGTGITFSGSIPETGTYGEIDETRCITKTIKYIGINADGTISLSDATQY